MSIALVSLADAKQQLSITSPDSDDLVTSLIYLASGILMRHAKLSTVPDAWYSADSPPVIIVPDEYKSPLMLIISELHHNRESSVINLEPALSMIPRDPTFA